ncbi:MAG: hypothetical protein ACOVO2_15170 [Emticicia sp.]|uniref:hypothetical protein n=1 Tax=Emticicia sp. TaxID=1930953 RepID=UPI003BA46742
MKKVIDSKWLSYMLLATPYLMMAMGYLSSNKNIIYALYALLCVATPIILYKNWGNKQYFYKLALFSFLSLLIYFYVVQK